MFSILQKSVQSSLKGNSTTSSHVCVFLFDALMIQSEVRYLFCCVFMLNSLSSKTSPIWYFAIPIVWSIAHSYPLFLSFYPLLEIACISLY